MLLAAARAVAELADISTPGAPLLPQVADLRETPVAVAAAVATAAEAEATRTTTSAPDRILRWVPVAASLRARCSAGSAVVPAARISGK